MENLPARRITPLLLYLTYTKFSIMGFGGVLFWKHRIMVEQERWMPEREFVETLGISQIIPGAPVFNMALMVGHRFAGWRGAMAAGLGFVSVPFFIMIGIAMLYQRFGDLPLAQRALTGMAAVAAGLLLCNGLKMARTLPRQWRAWGFVALCFVAVGMLRWPLIAVIGALGPLSVAAIWRSDAKTSQK